VFGEEPLDGITAELAAVIGGEQRIAGLAGLMHEPRAEDRDGRLSQWRDPLFAAFAIAADVCAVVQHDVAATQSALA
jgi:hypothetical protein